MQMTRVCIAGATGWTGRAVAEAALAAEDLEVTGAVGRRAAADDLGDEIRRKRANNRISASVEEVLEAASDDVLIDFTHPSVVKDHVKAALARGAWVVVGTSGLSAEDYVELDGEARK